MQHATTLLILGFLLLGITVFLLILPHPTFSSLAQTATTYTSIAAYRQPTDQQISRMKQEQLFCVRPQDCTTLCQPYYEPGFITTNKYFTQTNAGVQLENTCGQNTPEKNPTYDHLACIDNTCTPKSLFLNPKKIRSSFDFISLGTRPEVQLPYKDPVE